MTTKTHKPTQLGIATSGVRNGNDPLQRPLSVICTYEEYQDNEYLVGGMRGTHFKPLTPSEANRRINAHYDYTSRHYPRGPGPLPVYVTEGAEDVLYGVA